MAKKQRKEHKGLSAIAKAEKALRKAQELLIDATERLATLRAAAATPPIAHRIAGATKGRAKTGADPATVIPSTTSAKGRKAALPTTGNGIPTHGIIELRSQAKATGIAGYSRMNKAALLEALAR